MISNKTRFIFSFCITIIVVSSYLIWDQIALSVSDEKVKDFSNSIYVSNNYNHWNEILRFSYAVLLPSLILIIYLIFTNNFTIPIKEKIKSNHFKKSKGNLKLFFIISFIFIIIFLSYSPKTHTLDSLHEGMRLSAWENFIFYKNFWENSFITVGWGQEFLIPLLSNFFFDEVSINKTRLVLFFYGFINQFLLLILIYKISYIQNFKQDTKSIFFIFFSTIILFLSNFNNPILSHREIPIIIFFTLILNILNNKKIFIYLVLIGLLSSFSFLWSIDRGVFLNVLLFVFLILQILNNNYKNFWIIFLSVIFGWFIVYLFFEQNDFLNYLKNSLWIFSNIEYVYGLIHPTPFGDQIGSSRAGKNIFILTCTSLLAIKYGFSKNIKVSKNEKVFLLFLLLISLISYKIALGRSDGPHLRSAMFFSYLTLSYITLVNLGYFLDQNKSKDIFKKVLKFLAFFLFTGLIVKIIIIENKFFKKDFKSTIFKNYNNNFYYSKNKIELYKKLKKATKKEEFINNFSYDASIPFIVSKPSCNKYYFIYSLGGRKIQHDYINYLKKSNSNLIILKKNDRYIDSSIKNNLPIIFSYIKNNYVIFEEFKNYQIVKKK